MPPISLLEERRHSSSKVLWFPVLAFETRAASRIGHIRFVRFRLEGMLLVSNIEIFVVGAIEHVIAEDHIERFGAGIFRELRHSHHVYVCAYSGSARADKLPIYFNDTGFVDLNRPHEDEGSQS